MDVGESVGGLCDLGPAVCPRYFRPLNGTWSPERTAKTTVWHLDLLFYQQHHILIVSFYRIKLTYLLHVQYNRGIENKKLFSYFRELTLHHVCTMKVQLKIFFSFFVSLKWINTLLLLILLHNNFKKFFLC